MFVVMCQYKDTNSNTLSVKTSVSGQFLQIKYISTLIFFLFRGIRINKKIVTSTNLIYKKLQLTEIQSLSQL